MYPVSVRGLGIYNLRKVRLLLEEILSISWAGFSALKPGDHILLKPNLLSAKPPEAAVTTHPVVLEAMLQILLDAGCKITVGDSPAIQRFSTVVKKAGLQFLEKRYSVCFQELNDPVEIKGLEGGIFKTFEVSRHCLETDYFINIAKFKTHSMMGLTLSVKNLFGCIPGKKKAAWHLAIGKDRNRFARMLAELAAILPVDFNIIDGITGMEGNGPGNGTPVNLGILIGGENAPAVDIVAAGIIGISPQDLLTGQAAMEIKFGPASKEEITIQGDLPPRRPLPFQLPEPTRTDWHLPRFLKNILRWAFLPLPRINRDSCQGCLICQDVCPPSAIIKKNNRIFIKENLCIRCYCCQEICPENAITFKKKGHNSQGISL